MAGETVPIGRGSSAVRFFSDSVRNLTSTLVTSEVIRRLCDRAVALLDVDRCSVMTPDSAGALRIACAHGLDPEVIERTRISIGEAISGYVARTHTPLWVDDIEVDPRFRRRNDAGYSTPSLISVPILVRDRIRAVVNVNNRRDGKALSLDDLALLEDLAAHAGVALQNSERYEALLQRAQHDGLTGLANRSHLWAVFRTELARAQRHSRPLSVVMIDVDHFKRFNDTLGHLAGDHALERVAAVIRGTCRASDTAGRYGGEEFVVILPETPLDGAVSFAEKIRQTVEQGEWEVREPALTISAGVASFPTHGTAPKHLLQAADRQLYRAKARGRNRVCFPSDGAD